MQTQRRNVQFDRFGDGGNRRFHRRLLERILLSNRWLNKALSCAAQTVLTAMIWPRFVAPYRWGLTRYTLPIAGLGKGFDGYRILQLTDLHVGQTRVDYLEKVVDKTLAEKPDLIVITGDLIDYQRDALKPLKGLLPRIVAGAGRDGVLAIFGNHDYHEYSWRHIGERSAHRIIHRKLVEIVHGAGIRLLRNDAAAFTRGEDRLLFVGLDEMWTGRADPTAAFRGISIADAVICLQHNPDGVEFLQNYPWQVMLCGHSHGGQALFPGLGALYVPMKHRQYLQGFFDFPPAPGQPADLKRKMFVSRGLGHSTPIRMFCPPEATVFTLAGVEHSGTRLE